MVLMGINRIGHHSGRIRAQMGFRITAAIRDSPHSDGVRREERRPARPSEEGSPRVRRPVAEVRTPLTYVSSTKKDSQDELDFSANLTGEVDLKFKSDYFPHGALCEPQHDRPHQATPDPGANAPAGSATAKTAEVAD